MTQLEQKRQKFESAMRLRGYRVLEHNGKHYCSAIVEDAWQGFLMGWREATEEHDTGSRKG